MKTLVLGVGAFGVAILNHLSKNKSDETFYAFEKDANALEQMIANRKNPYFFTDITFAENVEFVRSLDNILPTIDLIVLIIPNQFMRSAIIDMKPFLKKGVTFLNLSKGIDNTTLRTVSDTLRDTLGDFPYHYGVLSGGMIASELVAGNMLGADIGIDDMEIGKDIKSLFESDKLAIELSSEYKNIELFGALKNVFALYVGFLEGKGLGLSTVGYHFALLWKDLAKLMPLLGGTANLDFSQFALGGDMIATAFGNSRNRYLGKLVGSGKSIQEALQVMKDEKKTAEGYETLKGMKAFIAGKGEFNELWKVIDIFLG